MVARVQAKAETKAHPRPTRNKVSRSPVDAAESSGTSTKIASIRIRLVRIVVSKVT